VSATLAHIKDWLGAELLTGSEALERTISMAHSADLMSDVLAFSHSDSVLLTGLTNPQVVRTAEVVVELAEEYGLPLMVSNLSMFDAVGILFDRGLRGWSMLDPEQDQ
jgi:energy-converting hydrogenase Eha subunit H